MSDKLPEEFLKKYPSDEEHIYNYILHLNKLLVLDGARKNGKRVTLEQLNKDAREMAKEIVKDIDKLDKVISKR